MPRLRICKGLPSIDDLRDQVAERFLEQHRDLVDAHPPDGATFEERSRAFVDFIALVDSIRRAWLSALDAILRSTSK